MKYLQDLQPTNGRKSFYGKAKIFDNGPMYVLISYNTQVAACFKHSKNFMIDKDVEILSNTTVSHVKAFQEWNGLEPQSKKELLNNKQ